MKKLFSLLLALVLTVSLVGCGKPAPDADRTVDALLHTLFREDITPMKDLFGYSSRDAVVTDWFNGEDALNQLLTEFVGGLTDSALQENITIDEADAQALQDALRAATARVPFTCTIDPAKTEPDTIVVTVSINTFPEDCLGNGALSYIYEHHLEDLLASSGDSAEMYKVIFSAFTAYINQLQPTEETATILVPCQLTDDAFDGKISSCWLPTNIAISAEQFTTAAYNLD